MSLIIFLFYWVGIPLILYRATRGLLRKAGTPMLKGGVIATSLAIALGLLWYAVGRTWWADWQVREMCAKDGGVRVYETVSLSPLEYNRYTNKITTIVVPYQQTEKKLKDNDEYYVERKATTLRNGRPEIMQSHFKLFRRRDERLLGEYISYSRRGGGLFGPWHESSYRCPESSKDVGLEPSVFVKGE